MTLFERKRLQQLAGLKESNAMLISGQQLLMDLMSELDENKQLRDQIVQAMSQETDPAELELYNKALVTINETISETEEMIQRVSKTLPRN